MSAQRIETQRLVLRAPTRGDAQAIFDNYASSPAVTRYLGWPRHESVADTHAFIEYSDAEWSRWPAGPLVIETRADSEIVGGTGLAFETPHCASTGYVLAREHWRRGYATEALAAIVSLAAQLGVRRLYALCHPDHARSWRVLERGGFTLEGTLEDYLVFPNLDDSAPQDVLCYARALDGAPPTAFRSDTVLE